MSQENVEPPEIAASAGPRCSALPAAIAVCSEQSVPVLVVSGLSELGHWDERDQVIRIRAEQPNAAKLCVLIHEMIHMAETQLLAAGILGRFYGCVIRPIWGERLVEHLSSFLFQWMGCSGMLAGITPAETLEFVEAHLEEWGDEAVVKVPG